MKQSRFSLWSLLCWRLISHSLFLTDSALYAIIILVMKRATITMLSLHDSLFDYVLISEAVDLIYFPALESFPDT